MASPFLVITATFCMWAEAFWPTSASSLEAAAVNFYLFLFAPYCPRKKAVRGSLPRAAFAFFDLTRGIGWSLRIAPVSTKMKTICALATSGSTAHEAPAGGISCMTKIFITDDIFVTAAIIAVEIMLFLQRCKKRADK